MGPCARSRGPWTMSHGLMGPAPWARSHEPMGPVAWTHGHGPMAHGPGPMAHGLEKSSKSTNCKHGPSTSKIS